MLKSSRPDAAACRPERGQRPPGSPRLVQGASGAGRTRGRTWPTVLVQSHRPDSAPARAARTPHRILRWRYSHAGTVDIASVGTSLWLRGEKLDTSRLAHGYVSSSLAGNGNPYKACSRSGSVRSV